MPMSLVSVVTIYPPRDFVTKLSITAVGVGILGLFIALEETFLWSNGPTCLS